MRLMAPRRPENVEKAASRQVYVGEKSGTRMSIGTWHTAAATSACWGKEDKMRHSYLPLINSFFIFFAHVPVSKTFVLRRRLRILDLCAVR